MDHLIRNFPGTLTEGAQLAAGYEVKTSGRLIICGMGGSSIPGEFLALLKPEAVLWQNYDLPFDARVSDVVICISWSGNTAETISSFERAQTLGIETHVITKGGALAQKAQEKNIPIVILPQETFPARLGAGYMTGALFAMVGLEKELQFTSADSESTGKALAQKIDSKIPLLYGAGPIARMGVLWKMLFNENSKIPAFWNSFPVAAHNEVEALTPASKDKFIVLVLKHTENKDITALLAFLDKVGYTYEIISAPPGESLVQTALQSYIVGLWTSYWLAQQLQVDPLKNEQIEVFKQLKA